MYFLLAYLNAKPILCSIFQAMLSELQTARPTAPHFKADFRALDFNILI